MSWGTGLGTTRRQPRPESSRTWYPVAFAKARASDSVMKAPMGFDGKRVVVALGGNALGDAPGEQLKLLEGASKNLARMVKEGINVVVTQCTLTSEGASVAFDFKKEYKEFYLPKRTPELVSVPPPRNRSSRRCGDRPSSTS